MRVCAEFEDHYTALAAHRHLIDEGLDSQEIEIRSPYPLPEHPIPPHRDAPMNLRPVVRCMWALAVLCGFSFVTYTQYEWAPVTATNGHPLIPIPITMLVTYECGMITAILTTTFMFFLETFRYRSLVPPLEEDMPVAIGYVALVVGGRSADRAMKLLEGQGARSVVSYLVMFMMLTFLTGCAQFNMRQQDVIKGTEAPAQFAPQQSVRMPGAVEQAVAPPAAIGYEVTGDQNLFNDYKANLAKMQFDKSAEAKTAMPQTQKMFAEAKSKLDATGTMPKMYALKDHLGDVDKEIADWVNPVKPTAEALERGDKLFTINCAQCHGAKGGGDGKVGEVCAPKPPAIGTKYNNASKSDGFFYFRIYSGQGQMPPFGYKLTPEEISSIVLHMRKLQNSN
ncbi:c-type cytochrome [bacterium]|nr:c-type cytochrome [bacterium]